MSNFNIWVVYAVVAFVAICLLGRFQRVPVVSGGKYKVKRRYADVVITMIAVAAACVLVVLIERESYYGVVQFLLDNVSTNGDVPVMVREEAEMGAHLLIIAVGVCYAVAARVFASIFSDAHKASLEKQLSKLRRQRRDMVDRWANNGLDVGD